MSPACFGVLLLAAQVDRAPKADEWGYRPPDGATVAVNPPSLSWAAVEGAAGYSVQWAETADFRGAATVEAVPWSVYTHSRALRPGTYYWRYRTASENGWSRARRFTVPADAVEFPQPTLEELRRRVPKSHPRLFVRAGDRDRLRAWSKAGGRGAYEELLRRADALLDAEPTPEPKVKASSSDPATNQFWWSNRVQAVKALQEAEILAFTYWLTAERKYGERARDFTLRLAAWDPDGPTNFNVNCEAAKPMLHRLARAYDWAYDAFTVEERARLRALLLRRAHDAWNSWEVKQGGGHLNQPYGSHANRTWHKLAENAIATFHETPEAEKFLEYGVTKFFAAYPVWADEDGGWHEGLSYYGGYLSKAAWWFDLARGTLGIDGFKKPFFHHFGEYPLYSAPPGSPEMGFGDLAHRPVSPAGWSFFHFFVRETRNPYWAWWASAWNLKTESDEPVLAFLWGAKEAVAPKSPAGLPPSKVFRGIGVAILNTTLESAESNVQVRFKSSPMGRGSHGLDPHNSFTLSAYGEALLVNNVYRDLYGSPFHKGWVWSTRSQNALLVDGEGQRARTAEPDGRIVKWEFQDGLDYVAGDATAAYEGKVKRYLRYVVFVKPDLVLLIDDVEAARPSRFQWMLHGQQEFVVDAERQQLKLNRAKAGVLVEYVSERPLGLRQWTGYEPQPDHRYLASVNSPGIPPQWHVEAATAEPAESTFTVTVLRPYRAGAATPGPLEIEKRDGLVRLRDAGTAVEINRRGPLAVIRKRDREWRLTGAAQ